MVNHALQYRHLLLWMRDNLVCQLLWRSTRALGGLPSASAERAAADQNNREDGERNNGQNRSRHDRPFFSREPTFLAKYTTHLVPVRDAAT